MTLGPFNHRLRHHHDQLKRVKRVEVVAVGEEEMNAEVEEEHMVIEEVIGDEAEEGDEKEAECKLEKLVWCKRPLVILNTTFR